MKWLKLSRGSAKGTATSRSRTGTPSSGSMSEMRSLFKERLRRQLVKQPLFKRGKPVNPSEGRKKESSLTRSQLPSSGDSAVLSSPIEGRTTLSVRPPTQDLDSVPSVRPPGAVDRPSQEYATFVTNRATGRGTARLSIQEGLSSGDMVTSSEGFVAGAVVMAGPEISVMSSPFSQNSSGDISHKRRRATDSVVAEAQREGSELERREVTEKESAEWKFWDNKLRKEGDGYPVRSPISSPQMVRSQRGSIQKNGAGGVQEWTLLTNKKPGPKNMLGFPERLEKGREELTAVAGGAVQAVLEDVVRTARAQGTKRVYGAATREYQEWARGWSYDTAKPQKYRSSVAGDPTHAVLGDRKGKKLTTNSWRTISKRMGLRFGILQAPHGLRGGGATFDLANGLSESAVIRLGRWKAEGSMRPYIDAAKLPSLAV